MTDSKPPAVDHVGHVGKVLGIIMILTSGGIGLVKMGMWLAELRAAPIPVQTSPELTAEVGACRELARILRAGPLPKETQR